MRGFDQIDAPWIDDDQSRPGAHTALEPRCEDRVRICRVRAHDQHDVSVVYRCKRLRAGRGAQRHRQPVPGWRVADTRAGVHIVVAKDRSYQFLDQIGFLIRAARRCDAADRTDSVLALDSAHRLRGKIDGFLPADFAPGVGDALADHRTRGAILVGRVAPGKAALDARVPLVGAPLHPGRHAHDLVAAQLGLEAAAHAAIGAGRQHFARRQPGSNDGSFLQRCRGAGLHAGAATDAFGA